jgi:hypothetical protein
MSALQSWRKAYGALKDTTTVSLANLNSDFKVRVELLHPPPIQWRKLVQFIRFAATDWGTRSPGGGGVWICVVRIHWDLF